MQVERFLGHIAMEVFRKNKLEKSVSSTDMYKSVCIYMCVYWSGSNIDKGEPNRILAIKKNV